MSVPQHTEGRHPMAVDQRTTFQAPGPLSPELMRMFATASREITGHMCKSTVLAEHTLAEL